MYRVTAFVLTLSAIAGAALAKSNSQMQACAAQWKSTPRTSSHTYKQFMTTCLHVGTPTRRQPRRPVQLPRRRYRLEPDGVYRPSRTK